MIGWLDDLQFADDYFKLFADWTSFSEDQKNVSLIKAYRALIQDGGFSFPDQGPFPLNMKQAQCELAYIYCKYNPEKREALQAQGVQSFSISTFSETFRSGSASDRRFTRNIMGLLQEYRIGRPITGVITRPMNKDNPLLES